MKSTTMLLLASASATMLSGCALLNKPRIDSAGPPVKSEDGFQSVDLPLALDPMNLPSGNKQLDECIANNGDACHGVGQLPGAPSFGIFTAKVDANSDPEDREEFVERLRLERAYYNFYKGPQTAGQTLEDRRNRVQQRLIGASDMNCGIFTQRIYGIQASANFGLGSFATILGGAGAIVTDVNSARGLSGASAIISGIRSEMNEDFFRKQWIEALAKAIENERGRLREGISTRVAQSIKDYPVEAAVADAIRYNDACSLVSGLKEVNRSVTIADDPAGLRAFRDAYERAGFEAQFNATVTSGSQTRSDRLRPATLATASVALGEIGADVAAARVLAAETLTRLEHFAPAPPDLPAAKEEIAALVAELHVLAKDGQPAAYGPRLKDYVAKLEAYRTEYATLSATMASAGDATARAQTSDLLEANDAGAEIMRRAARGAVDDIERKITKVADDRQPEPPPPVKTETKTPG